MQIKKLPNGKYMLEVRVDGKRQRTILLHVKTKQQAEIAARQKQQQIFDKKYQMKEQSPLLSDFIDTVYLPYSKANKLTWKNDEYLSGCLKEYFAGKQLHEISGKDIEEFKLAQLKHITPRDKPQTKSTINRKLSLLSAIFKRAILDQAVSYNPCANKSFKQKQSVIRYLTPEEEDRLLTFFIGARAYIRPIVFVALHTGMRRGEILNLKWVQIDFYRKTITVTQTKSGKNRTIPLSNPLYALLLDLKHKSKEDFDWVFESPKCEGMPIKDLKKGFKAALKDAKIPNFRFHDLRHTAATRLADLGVDPYTIMDIMGHQDIKTTMIYIHAAGRDKQNVMERLSNYSLQKRTTENVVGEISDHQLAVA